MQRILCTVLFWALILCACSTSISPADTFPQIATETTPSSPTLSTATTQAFSDSPALPIPRFLRTLETPHIDQPQDGEITQVPANPLECGYQWAYKDLPELSSSLQQSIQGLQPEAQANAFAFGEDCVRADGSATFTAMETDFNITLQVDDVYNESDLGGWTVKVMRVIESIPLDQIVGPRPGRVTIVFQSGDDEQNVIFYIDQYRKLPPNLSNLQIFAALKRP